MSTHLNALQLRLSNERVRQQEAKTTAEKELRAVWIKQIENEIAKEYEFLGMSDGTSEHLSDEELLKQLYG